MTADSTLPPQIALHFQASCPHSRCNPKVYSKIPDSLSAVLHTPDGYLWLASDETCTLERLSVQPDGSYGDHQHFHLIDFLDLPAGEDHEIDIEGLDATDSYLWLVGSHSHKRKQPKSSFSVSENSDRLADVDTEANRYLLARIPVVEGQLFKAYPPQQPTLRAGSLETKGEKNVLIEALLADQHLSPFLQAKIPGKDNGFDIEGLVVTQDRIWLGLRGPVLRGWSMILECKIQEIPGGGLKLKKISGSKQDGELYQKHFLDLGGLGIRDLFLWEQDLLILAGPTLDLDGPVRLFRLPAVRQAFQDPFWGKPQYLLDLPYGAGKDHAEGFVLLPETQQLLVVYDAPASSRRDNQSVLADLFAFALKS
jgi:Protein of unknown function (DUF3616)